MTSLPVLVVEHAAQCPSGWVGEWLEEAGCALDVRRPHAGDALPDRLDEHRSVVVLGGPMDADADERHPWLPSVRDLLRGAAGDRVPTLGICLGHQLAALAFGGSVHKNPRGPQIGVLEVGWLPEAKADPLLAEVTGARVAVQWNNDVVDALPADATVLATTAAGEVQAARFAPTVWGVQWHPEVGEEIVALWAENDRALAEARGIDVDERLAQVAAAREELRSTWRPLVTAFAALTREAAASW